MNSQTTPIRPGDTFESWCSTCGHATPHVWMPGSKKPLECQACKEATK